MLIGLHVKYPLFLSHFNETWNISTDVWKILKYHILMKIRSVGAELLHADGRTDRQTDSLHSRFAVLRTCLKTNCSFAWNIFKSIYWSLKCAWNVYLRHVSLEIVALYRSKLLTPWILMGFLANWQTVSLSINSFPSNWMLRSVTVFAEFLCKNLSCGSSIHSTPSRAVLRWSKFIVFSSLLAYY